MEETKPLSDKERLNAERKELNLLIGRGISFDVKRTVYRRRPGLLGRFRGKVPVPEVVSYRIQEPTLSTLDRMSALQVDLDINEDAMRSEGALREARHMTGAHSRRLARIVATAVMGQDYVQIHQKGGRTVYVNDDTGLDELTDILFNGLAPSQLAELVIYINTISNLGDFCNSIRLMSAVRTTMPIRVEENKEG
jgi:hypothetical protein